MRSSIITVVLLYVFMMLFAPTSKQVMNDVDIKRTKQTLNLASKVLVNSIDLEGVSYETFSLGYYLENEDFVKIDKDKLLSEFKDVLYKRYLNADSYQEMQRRIPALVLTYGDRFYVAERKLVLKPGGNRTKLEDHEAQFVWLAPMFYTVVDDNGRLLYLNLRDETSTFYQYQGGKSVPVKVSNDTVRIKGQKLTKELRDSLVIDSINRVVQAITYDPAHGSQGFKLQIRPDDFGSKDTSNMSYNERQDYYRQLREVSNFNVLEGITFFIIYASDDEGVSYNDRVVLRNYNAAGFTLWKRY